MQKDFSPKGAQKSKDSLMVQVKAHLNTVQSTSGRPTPKDLRTKLCGNCKKTGHWGNECPKKKKADSKKEEEKMQTKTEAKVNVMRCKGSSNELPIFMAKIGKTSVCVLANTGATHNILSREILASLDGHFKRSNEEGVVVIENALGTSEEILEKVDLKLQLSNFSANVKSLVINLGDSRGFDMILGVS